MAMLWEISNGLTVWFGFEQYRTTEIIDYFGEIPVHFTGKMVAILK